MKRQKIGLLGGTFDPVHLGHLVIAEIARDELGLHKVLFVPVNQHAIKKNNAITPAPQRLEMLEIALATNRHFSTCDLELRREGISYTIDTLRELRQVYPENSCELHFLLGIDNVLQFSRWKEPEQLLELCRFVAFGRPGYNPILQTTPYATHFRLLEMPLLEISSSEIRNRLQHGKTVRYLLQREVERYIRRQNLYRPPS